MTLQEKYAAIWRYFGHHPVTPIPPENAMAFCKHYVKTPGKTFEVDEPVYPVLVDLNPMLRVGQCPACQCIYWFTSEEPLPVLRVDKDTVPDEGGVGAKWGPSELEGALAEASSRLREHGSRKERRRKLRRM